MKGKGIREDCRDCGDIESGKLLFEDTVWDWMKEDEEVKIGGRGVIMINASMSDRPWSCS